MSNTKNEQGMFHKFIEIAAARPVQSDLFQ